MTIFNEEIDANKVLTMEQLLRQPFASLNNKQHEQQLLPAKVKLMSRRGMRCLQCDTILYKSEYNPVTVKPRTQVFFILIFNRFFKVFCYRLFAGY